MRRWVAGLLPRCPGRDDLVTVASELAANAVQHTDSGLGGWFHVEISWPPGYVRVTVADQGAPTGPRLATAPAEERGRGLQIAQALSARIGVTGGARGRAVWAEIPWTSSPPCGELVQEDGPRHGAAADPGRSGASLAVGPDAPQPAWSAQAPGIAPPRP